MRKRGGDLVAFISSTWRVLLTGRVPPPGWSPLATMAESSSNAMDVDAPAPQPGAGGESQNGPRFQVKKVRGRRRGAALTDQWNSVCLWSWDIQVDNVRGGA